MMEGIFIDVCEIHLGCGRHGTRLNNTTVSYALTLYLRCKNAHTAKK